MFLLYGVLLCNFAISSQICKTFCGLIFSKCCNIVFCLSLLYVGFIFPPCKCKYCHKQCCDQINIIKKKHGGKSTARLRRCLSLKALCYGPFHS